MKLTRKNPLQARACALAAISIALVTMAASKVAADDMRVFNERVSGVPSAHPVAIADNVYSPEFAPGWSLKVSNCSRIPGLDYGIRQLERWHSH
jgi:hypothetical protein